MLYVTLMTYFKYTGKYDYRLFCMLHLLMHKLLYGMYSIQKQNIHITFMSFNIDCAALRHKKKTM